MVTVALVLLLGTAQDLEWKAFTSPEGGFSVQMPGVPKEQKRKITTPAGNLHVTLFVLEGKKVTYAVSYAVFPPKVVETGTPQQRLDKARDGAVVTAMGKLKSEKKITLGSHPGREVLIENTSPGAVATRLFVVKDRLYQITITGPRSILQAAETAKFLESFQLQK